MFNNIKIIDNVHKRFDLAGISIKDVGFVVNNKKTILVQLPSQNSLKNAYKPFNVKDYKDTTDLTQTIVDYIMVNYVAKPKETLSFY